MRHKFLIPLLTVIALDSILTWVLWTNGLMEEGNPLMLWGLNQGAMVYWGIKCAQMLITYILIMNVDLNLKVFRYGYLAVMGVYSYVMIGFAVILIGLL